MAHKIMVVDDNSATRRMVGDALRKKGHDVIEAPDGKTARALMKSEHPRVVLQDIMLPDADGFTLVGELRDLAGGTDVSILAFSGFFSELDEARVSTVGFDDIIAKPIAPSRLVPLIEAHLPQPVSPASRFGAGRRVVIADDDPMQLKLASVRLARMGFDVEAVPDGRAALEAVRRIHADAIVSDVMMPELDGFGVAMAVRQDPALRDVPVILVTSSYVESADRDLARRAGATDLVPRTPGLGEMIEAIRSSLGQPRGTVPPPESLPALELEHNQRVFRQLERQVRLNHGLSKRCSMLASELAVLSRISDAMLVHGDLDGALDEAVAECFDAGGISHGALYLLDTAGALRVRPIGEMTADEDLATLYGHRELLLETLHAGRTLETFPQKLFEQARATAMLLVPFVHGGHVLGGLLMVGRGRELERSDWYAFAQGVATQLSHALALARAYADREAAQRRATGHAAVLDALFEAAPDLVMQLDLDGNLQFANREPPPELVDGAELQSAFDRLKRTGEPQGFEVSAMRDGKTTWHSTRLGPITEDDKLVGVVVVARDITSNKQTEMHLLLSDRMASVGTLAAGVAHEINNPLTSVIANLDIALAQLAATNGSAELTDELRDARNAANRVREIVRDLKIFSRENEAEEHTAVDVEQVLESTIRMAWNELRHRARVVRSFGDVPHVDAHDSRLGQVFLNLLVNAAHAIVPGNFENNEIRIGTSVDPVGRVVITIADTGTGIPVEARVRLFTPFFTTKAIGEGTGLGLAISQRIITQFGGTIAFETEVGKGTEFRVTLPAAAAPPPRIDAPTTKLRSKARRRGNVLVSTTKKRSRRPCGDSSRENTRSPRCTAAKTRSP